MGGNKSQKKSSFSLFGIFKHKKSQGGGSNGTWEDSIEAYKVYPSDQDRAGYWADPCIDSKASAYIETITNKWNHVSRYQADDLMVVKNLMKNLCVDYINA